MRRETRNKTRDIVATRAVTGSISVAALDLFADGALSPASVAILAVLGLSAAGNRLDRALIAPKAPQNEHLECYENHPDAKDIWNAYFADNITDFEAEAMLDERIFGHENPWKDDLEKKVWPRRAEEQRTRIRQLQPTAQSLNDFLCDCKGMVGDFGYCNGDCSGLEGRSDRGKAVGRTIKRGPDAAAYEVNYGLLPTGRNEGLSLVQR